MTHHTAKPGMTEEQIDIHSRIIHAATYDTDAANDAVTKSVQAFIDEIARLRAELAKPDEARR